MQMHIHISSTLQSRRKLPLLVGKRSLPIAKVPRSCYWWSPTPGEVQMRRSLFSVLLMSLAWLSLLLCAASGLHAQTFNLQAAREPVASLDGLWRFHTGDNPAWADPNFDDSQWPLLRSDEAWSQQGYENYGGFAWYRFSVTVPEGSRNWSIYLGPKETGY